jgi:hypothetical protein
MRPIAITASREAKSYYGADILFAVLSPSRLRLLSYHRDRHASRKRPCPNTAEKRNELAPVHPIIRIEPGGTTHSCYRKDSTPQCGKTLLRCEISIQATSANGPAVRPYSKSEKNDYRDVEAIAEAVQRPTMKFVATKTADQLDLQQS